METKQLFLMGLSGLKIYDNKGVVVAEFDKPLKGKLVHNSIGDSYFTIDVADFNVDLTKALADDVVVENFNLEEDIPYQSTKIKFKPLYNHENIKYFKLVAEGVLYDGDGKVTHDIKLNINESFLESGLNFDFDNMNPSGHTHIFRISVDNDGYSFELELIEK